MIVISAQGLQLMADALALTLREQIEAGIDGEGNAFPPGVDLIRTGALLASMRGVVIDGVPSVEVGVPYAPYVLGRYKADQIAPQFVPVLEQRWQPILAAHATYQEATP